MGVVDELGWSMCGGVDDCGGGGCGGMVDDSGEVEARGWSMREIGGADGWTPVTTLHTVCCARMEQKNTKKKTINFH